MLSLLPPIPSITVALSNLLLSFSVSNNSDPLLWQQSSVQKQANIALATNHNLFAVRNLLSCLVKLIFSTVSFMMAVAKITKPYHGGRRLRSYRCYCDIILAWWWADDCGMAWSLFVQMNGDFYVGAIFRVQISVAFFMVFVSSAYWLFWASHLWLMICIYNFLDFNFENRNCAVVSNFSRFLNYW